MPADAEDPEEAGGIRFRAGVALAEGDLLALNARYKSHWPSMENELKALQARGFGRNRTRRREPTTRRGTDGALERLHAREVGRVAKVEALGEQPATRRTVARQLRAAGTRGLQLSPLRFLRRASPLVDVHLVELGLVAATPTAPATCKQSSPPCEARGRVSLSA